MQLGIEHTILSMQHECETTSPMSTMSRMSRYATRASSSRHLELDLVLEIIFPTFCNTQHTQLRRYMFEEAIVHSGS
jgi:hypothetical protein